MTSQADRRRPIDDPDTPSEAVGTFPWPDLGRLGIPAVGWVFVVGAALVGAVHLESTLSGPLEATPFGLAFGVAAVAVALQPAALLRSAPDAVRTHPVLLAGLALAAVAQLVVAVMSFWSIDIVPPGYRALPLDFIQPLLAPVAYLLIGAGLLRLRAGPITRLPLLLAFVVPALAIMAGWTALLGPFEIDAYAVMLFILVPSATAFVLWVPVAAWLDRAPPRRFWSLLAAGTPLTIASVLFLVPATVAVLNLRSNDMFVVSTTADAIARAAMCVLAFIAYGRYVPGAAQSEQR